ncbi:DUF418 domain-containing protein [Thermodesulfobacteriota bacterium]
MKNENALSSRPHSRIFGYDLARTVALMGMVIISFWELAGEQENSPDWLNAFVEIIMGRAAVAFVMLAGVGLFLLTKAAYLSNDPKILKGSRKNLMKRALFLFIIGILNSLIWPWDILHFYAIYFIIGAFMITASNRTLWALILSAIFVFAVIMLMIQFEREEAWESIGPTDLWHLSGVFYHLLFGGLYPVFPWIGFLFMGMWIGHRDLTNRNFRKKILLASIVTVILFEGASWIFFQTLTSEWRLQRFEKLIPWFDIDPWFPMPFFFFSGAGSAIIAISLCVILTEKFSAAKWLPPLVAVGQSTLTLYVAHTLIGTITILAMDFFELEYPLFAVWGSFSYFIAAMFFCHQWNIRYKRGPLELLMRRFLARPIRLTFSGVHPIEFTKRK